VPHLYDHWERGLIAKYLHQEMVFVDIGANIGAYSLWASKYLGAGGKIVAIEADPIIFKKLSHNLHQNHIVSDVVLINGGISDKAEELSFFRNTTGNAGGSSFVVGDGEAIQIKCDTLFNVLRSAQISKVDFIKIDIEGFEFKVLKKYFVDTKEIPELKPKYLLIEILEGPLKNDGKLRKDLMDLLETQGYLLVGQRGNSLFRLGRV